MGLPESKVKQDVPTRWNSILIMIKRLQLIKAVVASLAKAPEFLTASEWEMLADWIPILKPVEKKCRDVRRKVPNYGFNYPISSGTAVVLKMQKSKNTKWHFFKNAFNSRDKQKTCQSRLRL